jgi:signal peptidase I
MDDEPRPAARPQPDDPPAGWSPAVPDDWPDREPPLVAAVPGGSSAPPDSAGAGVQAERDSPPETRALPGAGAGGDGAGALTTLPTPGGRRRGGTRRRRAGSFWRELPFLVLIALVLALLIKAFVLQAFFIPTGSMEPTLMIGDRVLVNKLDYRFGSIHRGQIIVFKGPPDWAPEAVVSTPSNPIVRFFRDLGSAFGLAPSEGKDFIKRVIGLPGDTVRCNQQDRVVVNGVVLHEPYVYPGEVACGSDSAGHFTVHVPAGRLWVMGDHRENSSDSRAHMDDHLGTIPVSNVIGRAFVIVWPPSRIDDLPVPKTFTSHAVGLAAGGVPMEGGLVGAVTLMWLRRRARGWRRNARRV